MRRLNEQLLIRTDKQTKVSINLFCEETMITLHELLEDLVNKIDRGVYQYGDN